MVGDEVKKFMLYLLTEGVSTLIPVAYSNIKFLNNFDISLDKLMVSVIMVVELTS